MGKYEVTGESIATFMSMYDVFKDFESRDVRSVNDEQSRRRHHRAHAVVRSELYVRVWAKKVDSRP